MKNKQTLKVKYEGEKFPNKTKRNFAHMTCLVKGAEVELFLRRLLKCVIACRAKS